MDIAIATYTYETLLHLLTLVLFGESPTGERGGGGVRQFRGRKKGEGGKSHQDRWSKMSTITSLTLFLTGGKI